MSVVPLPGMAYDTTTRKMRLVGTLTVQFDVTVDDYRLPALEAALDNAGNDAERAAVIARYLVQAGNVQHVVDVATTRGMVHVIERDYTISATSVVPFCDHDNLKCDACITTCRVCEETHATGGALRAHVATAHEIGRNDCANCGRHGGHTG